MCPDMRGSAWDRTEAFALPYECEQRGGLRRPRKYHRSRVCSLSVINERTRKDTSIGWRDHETMHGLVGDGPSTASKGVESTAPNVSGTHPSIGRRCPPSTLQRLPRLAGPLGSRAVTLLIFPQVFPLLLGFCQRTEARDAATASCQREEHSVMGEGVHTFP